MFYPASVAFLQRDSHIIKMKLAQLQHLADSKGFILPCEKGKRKNASYKVLAWWLFLMHWCTALNVFEIHSKHFQKQWISFLWLKCFICWSFSHKGWQCKSVLRCVALGMRDLGSHFRTESHPEYDSCSQAPISHMESPCFNPGIHSLNDQVYVSKSETIYRFLYLELVIILRNYLV